MISAEDFLSCLRDWHANRAAFAFVEQSEAAVLLLACSNISPDAWCALPPSAGEDVEGHANWPSWATIDTHHHRGTAEESSAPSSFPSSSVAADVAASTVPHIALALRSGCCQRELLLRDEDRTQLLTYAATLVASGALWQELASALSCTQSHPLGPPPSEKAGTESPCPDALSFASAHEEGCLWGNIRKTTAMLLSPVNPRDVTDSWVVRWKCAAVTLALSHHGGSTDGEGTVRKVLLPRGAPPSVLRPYVNDCYAAYFAEEEEEAATPAAIPRTHDKDSGDEPNSSPMSGGEDGSLTNSVSHSAREGTGAARAALPLLMYDGCSVDARILNIFFAPRVPQHSRLCTYKRRRQTESEEREEQEEPVLASLEDRARWYLCLLMRMLGMEFAPSPPQPSEEDRERAEHGGTPPGEPKLEDLMGCQLRCAFCAGRPRRWEDRAVEARDGEEAEMGPLREAEPRPLVQKNIVTHHLSLEASQCEHCACCPWKGLFLDAALQPPRGNAASITTGRDMSFTFRINTGAPSREDSSALSKGENATQQREERMEEEEGVCGESDGGGVEGMQMNVPSLSSLPPTPTSEPNEAVWGDERSDGDVAVPQGNPDEEDRNGRRESGEDGGESEVGCRSEKGEGRDSSHPVVAEPDATGATEVPSGAPVVTRETQYKIAFHIAMSTVERLIVCWRASEDAERRFREEYLHHPLPHIVLHAARPPHLGAYHADQEAPAAPTTSTPTPTTLSVESFLSDLQKKCGAGDGQRPVLSPSSLFYGVRADSAEAVAQMAANAIASLGRGRGDEGGGHTGRREKGEDGEGSQTHTPQDLLRSGRALLSGADAESLQAFKEKMAAALPAFRTPRTTLSGQSAEVAAVTPAAFPLLPAAVVAETISSLYESFLPDITCAVVDSEEDGGGTVISVEPKPKGQHQKDAEATASDSKLASAFLEELRQRTALAEAAAAKAPLPAASTPAAPPKPSAAHKQQPRTAAPTARRQPTKDPHPTPRPLPYQQQRQQHHQQPFARVGEAPPTTAAGHLSTPYAHHQQQQYQRRQQYPHAQQPFQLSPEATPFFPGGGGGQGSGGLLGSMQQTPPPPTTAPFSSDSPSGSIFGAQGGTTPSSSSSLLSGRPSAMAPLHPQQQQHSSSALLPVPPGFHPPPSQPPSLFGQPSASSLVGNRSSSTGGPQLGVTSVFGPPSSSSSSRPSDNPSHSSGGGARQPQRGNRGGGGGVLSDASRSPQQQQQQQQPRRGGGSGFGRGRFDTAHRGFGRRR